MWRSGCRPVGLILALALAACGGGTSSGTDGGEPDGQWETEILLFEDFEGYPTATSLAGQGGWLGDDILIGDRVELGSRAASGQLDTGALASAELLHPLAPIDRNGVVELRFRAYAYLRHPLTDKAGVLLSAAGGGTAGWLASKGAGLAWRFDLRSLTGNVDDFEDIFEGYSAPVTLSLVLDGDTGEAYGIYDFGSGPRHTKHVVITPSQLASLSSVTIVQDYYEPTDHLGADIDDLEVILHRPLAR